jgi:CBS domain-containing protein
MINTAKLNAAGEAGGTDQWQAWKPVATIMRSDVLRVSVDCPRETLTAMFHSGSVGFALVVDGDGKPIGIVHRSGLTREVKMAGAGMIPTTFTLNESIPISLAAALMASAGVDEVPIVSSTLGAVGLLTSIELMSWIARQAGHRVIDPSAVTSSSAL